MSMCTTEANYLLLILHNFGREVFIKEQVFKESNLPYYPACTARVGKVIVGVHIAI